MGEEVDVVLLFVPASWVGLWEPALTWFESAAEAVPD